MSAEVRVKEGRIKAAEGRVLKCSNELTYKEVGPLALSALDHLFRVSLGLFGDLDSPQHPGYLGNLFLLR